MYSVVIPTKNRPDDLRRLCNSLICQTERPTQIVVVDQSSVENVIEMQLPSEIELDYLYKPEITGLTQAKNLGIKKCKYDVIYFFDDDIICDANFCEVINNHFKKNPQLYGICGRQKNSKSSRFKVVVFSFFHRGPFKDIRKKCNSGFVKERIVETNVLPGGITAYRREVFNEFSFDELLINYCLGEDMDFSYRVYSKYKLAFATDALALHNHSQVGRYDPVESYACKVAGYAYFNKKNICPNLKNNLAYLLVNFGIIADAGAYLIKNRSFDAFRGYLKGKRYLKKDFKGVPFIDYERLEKR